MNMKEALAAAIKAAAVKAIAAGTIKEGDLPEVLLEVPPQKEFGDFATNFAMQSARGLKCNPRLVAQAVIDNLDCPYVAKAEIAGPGFINFYLKQNWTAELLASIVAAGADYGNLPARGGEKIQLEYVSANPTGPLHVGHGRGAAVGSSLANLLKAAGYDVTREYYINDAGNQIEKFATSLEVRYLQQFQEGIEMPEDAYQGADIVAHAQAFAAENGDRYVHCDAKERRDALVAFALPKNIAGLERDLKQYRIVYDNWFRESSLHQNGSVKRVVEELTARGYTYEQDGAVWFKATEFGADKDFVLVRANGIPTYIVPDIAYHYDKLVTRKFDQAIDVLGADHHGYVPRLKAALTALGVDASRLDVVLMQMVLLLRNGEVAKLSKRSGKAITLVTLLEDIPVDAARFFFNMRESNSHFEFDLDLAVEQSSQNPVYYVQYAHARICSLIRTMEEADVTLQDSDEQYLDLLEQPQEIELIRHIASLPVELDHAAASFDPSKITKYAIELATLFHKFYDACSVKHAETEELQRARLLLCSAVRQTLANTLQILKITCPEKM